MRVRKHPAVSFSVIIHSSSRPVSRLALRRYERKPNARNRYFDFIDILCIPHHHIVREHSEADGEREKSIAHLGIARPTPGWNVQSPRGLLSRSVEASRNETIVALLSLLLLLHCLLHLLVILFLCTQLPCDEPSSATEFMSMAATKYEPHTHRR